MTVARNTFKAALKDKQAQIGFWQSLAVPMTAEISAGAGFDWLLFDGEHGPNDIPLLLAQLQAISSYPAHAVGRPPFGETRLIKQYLDIGFTSLLIPMVETAAKAAELVRAVRYPPDGVRGVATGVARAARWGRTAGYIDDADAEICLLIQVETRKGHENLDEIAAVDGVDGVFIGPADLSAAMGFRGRPTAPEMQAIIEDAGARIQKAGKAAGILMADRMLAKRYLELGFTFVAVGSDAGLFASQTSALVNAFKEQPAKAATGPSVY
jgi:4-hydroxy-2-oxoheptanedioate aldolase